MSTDYKQPMKIVFIVASLEHGKDGVGDYSRKLAVELVALGNECLCIAINDHKLKTDECCTDVDLSRGHGPHELRFSGRQTWGHRLQVISEVIDKFRPDWISLQYVPWGYDPRGLPRQLPSQLRRITARYPLHIMCHELWMEGPLFSIKNQLIGYAQKLLYRRLLNVLRPQMIHTQTALYRDMLCSIGESCEILPLHGNIAVSSSRADGLTWLSKRIGSSNGELCLGFFGEMHSSLDSEKVAALARECASQACPSWILSGGSLNADSLMVWKELKQYFTDKTRFALLGRMEEREVSHYLAGLTMGLTSYPWEFVGKSGGVAAMLEHGLAVRLLGRSVRNRYESREDFLFPRDSTSVVTTAKRFIEALSTRVHDPYRSPVS